MVLVCHGRLTLYNIVSNDPADSVISTAHIYIRAQEQWFMVDVEIIKSTTATI